MAVADTDVNIFEDTDNSGNGGGGGATIDIISSRNTIEVSRSGDIFDVNVANEESRNFFVKNFHEFMDAVQTIANLYIAGDKVGNVIQLLGNIDMTDPSAEDEANYILSNGDNLIDRANMIYNFRQYLHYTKIVSYGAKRLLQLLTPNAARTAYDTWQLNIIRLTAENIGIGGDIAAWIDEFHHGNVSRSLPCEFQRYLFSSPGNVYYDLRSCNITCAGASQSTPNAFNPLLKMDNTLNVGIWISAMYLTDCRFIAGRSLLTPDPDLNAPIVINSNWFENRRKILQLKQMSKEVNATVLETGAPNIQIRTDNVAQAQTTWRSHQWEVSTDGTALVSCSVGEDCLAFAPKLALNDLYIQGQPDLQPEGATPTYNYVSLVEVLKQLLDNMVDKNDLFDELDYLGDEIGHETITEEYTKDDFDVSDTIIRASDGSEVQSPALNWNSTSWVLIVGVSHLIVKLRPSVTGGIAFYNAQKQYISGTQTYNENTETEITIPSNAIYMRACCIITVNNQYFKLIYDSEGVYKKIEDLDADKLGYWKGETANLPPVGSREVNKLYITTDY